MTPIKIIIKLLILWLLDIFGINALYRLINRNKAIILWYHGICNEEFTLTNRHLPKSLFHKHLSYLIRKGYNFVNMSELLAILSGGNKIEKIVVLTFDDGFKNIIDNAYPVMQEFGAKGCFYLVSDLVGTDQLLWTDYVETVIRNQHQGGFRFIYKGEEINYDLRNEKLQKFADYLSTHPVNFNFPTMGKRHLY